MKTLAGIILIAIGLVFLMPAIFGLAAGLFGGIVGLIAGIFAAVIGVIVSFVAAVFGSLVWVGEGLIIAALIVVGLYLLVRAPNNNASDETHRQQPIR